MAVEIMVGDCRVLLDELEAESVDCVVTSPPYFGLRDYETARWEGGSPDCDHMGRAYRQRATINSTMKGLEDRKNGTQREPMGAVCRKCGAVRIDEQIGLEDTFEDFVAALVEVFEKVRRVLKPEGTIWLNLGDSYARNASKGGSGPGGKNSAYLGEAYTGAQRREGLGGGVKEKDLIGIPWRVAFAMQAAGWYLRNDIIWNKPNPMPEPVRDRCTKAHEYVFLLSKSATYHFDADAIAEPSVYPVGSKPDAKRGTFAGKNAAGPRGKEAFRAIRDTRNRRDVWTIAPQPFAGAHFAVMPPDLAELCILAGCPKGGLVLDPFGGAGTTGLVAAKHGRDALLLELNPKFAAIAQARLKGELVEVSGAQEPARGVGLPLFDEAI